MSLKRAPPKARKRRLRKARIALKSFHSRLSGACGSFQTADEWYEFMAPLQAILEEYAGDLAPDHLERITKAMQLGDTTREDIGTSCDALQGELAAVLAALPGVGPWAALLAGIPAAALITVLALIAFLNLSGVEVVVENDACPPLELSDNLPPGLSQILAVLGTRIPSSIEAGGQGTARVPGITVGLDATVAGIVSLSAFGIAIPLAIPAAVTGIEFDSQVLFGQSSSVDLSERRIHQLVVSCR